MTTLPFKASLKTPFITSLRRVDSLEDIIVCIECDNGLKGYGECAPTVAITGESEASIFSSIGVISNALIGKDLDKNFSGIIQIVHDSIQGNTSAKSAIEIALYDLISKQNKMPLFVYLGGFKKEFETDVTISLKDSSAMLQDALKAHKEGFHTLKIKLGSSPKEDIQRVITIANALPHLKLRLDANQAWSTQESINIMQELEMQKLNIELLEQPIKANDIKGLKKIKDAIQTPLLADEAVFDIRQAQTILQSNSADLINIKLAKSGGISKALEIASECRKYGVKCMIGCMLEGPIAITAALHVASAAADVIQYIDLDAMHLIESNSLKSDIVLDGAKITLGTSFGLGVEP
ncbi:MAG: dipeptide epimerase [Campylobacterales bacterium]|nr:dipeptide epimerase [Campylobacterales bacterium]